MKRYLILIDSYRIRIIRAYVLILCIFAIALLWGNLIPFIALSDYKWITDICFYGMASIFTAIPFIGLHVEVEGDDFQTAYAHLTFLKTKVWRISMVRNVVKIQVSEADWPGAPIPLDGNTIEEIEVLAVDDQGILYILVGHWITLFFSLPKSGTLLFSKEMELS